MKQFPETIYERRREWVFLLLAGLFLGAMAMLNVVGITRIVNLGPLTVAVGVLPYPITFLCTDLISELYGKKRATTLVWVGLVVNVFIIAVMWFANMLPSVPLASQPPWQTLFINKAVSLPNGATLTESVELYTLIYSCTAGAVVASMFAYLTAQFCDVFVFHFWKKLTRGKHLWLRNNGSTLISQFVDTFMVVAITFGAAFYKGDIGFNVMLTLFIGGYSFKILAALVDTIPFYIGVRYLKSYLNLDPMAEIR